jgi:hypothetical protein
MRKEDAHAAAMDLVIAMIRAGSAPAKGGGLTGGSASKADAEALVTLYKDLYEGFRDLDPTEK